MRPNGAAQALATRPGAAGYFARCLDFTSARTTGTSTAAIAVNVNTADIGRMKKIPIPAFGNDERLSQRPLGERPEHESQNERRRRITELLHRITEHAEHQHLPHVPHAVLQRIRARDAEDDDDRHQYRVRHAQRANEQRDGGGRQNQQHHVGDVLRSDQAPHEFGVLLEQHRPGAQAPHHQAAEHDGGRRRTRNAECEHRHHRAGGGGVVRRLGPGHAFDRAVAEFLGVLGELLLHRVRHEGRDRRPGAGQRADQKAEQACRARSRSASAASPWRQAKGGAARSGR